MSNTTQKQAYRSLAGILSSRPFGRGFSDYRKGLPLEPEAYPVTNDQWRYERGRLFAAYYSGALRVNRRLAWEAKAAASEALRHGALI